jgi:hypothetical protein
VLATLCSLVDASAPPAAGVGCCSVARDVHKIQNGGRREAPRTNLAQLHMPFGLSLPTAGGRKRQSGKQRPVVLLLIVDKVGEVSSAVLARVVVRWRSVLCTLRATRLI